MLKNYKVKSIFTTYLIVLVISMIIAFYYHLNERMNSKSTNKAPSHLLQINILLHSLRTQCVNEDLDGAQNTFLDLMQEWQYQDVIMINKKHEYYFPSDSLARLDSLLSQLNKSRENKPIMQMVLREIKLINRKIDATE
jgi:hypothetical protein